MPDVLCYILICVGIIGGAVTAIISFDSDLHAGMAVRSGGIFSVLISLTLLPCFIYAYHSREVTRTEDFEIIYNKIGSGHTIAMYIDDEGGLHKISTIIPADGSYITREYLDNWNYGIYYLGAHHYVDYVVSPDGERIIADKNPM